MSQALRNSLKSFKVWVLQSLPSGVNPPFEIRPSRNKGLGVFARRPIPRASIIMRDRLVLRFEKGEKLQQVYRRFSRLPRPIQERALQLAVLRDVERAVGLKFLLDGVREDIIVERSAAVKLKFLLDGVGEDVIPKVMHLADVLNTNAFRTVIDDPKSPSGLFLTASRFNHSCVPNAGYFFGDEPGWKSFVANRDITEGEEITVTYIDHLQHRTERQQKLKNWAINCQCPGCDVNHPYSRAHEDRIKRIVCLNQDRCMDHSGRLKAGICRSRNTLEHAAKWARKRIKLLSGHCSFHMFLRQAYLGALEIAIIQYKLDRLPSKLTEAIEFLELVIELDLMFYGSNSATTNRDRNLCLRLKQGHVPVI